MACIEMEPGISPIAKPMPGAWHCDTDGSSIRPHRQRQYRGPFNFRKGRLTAGETSRVTCYRRAIHLCNMGRRVRRRSLQLVHSPSTITPRTIRTRDSRRASQRRRRRRRRAAPPTPLSLFRMAWGCIPSSTMSDRRCIPRVRPRMSSTESTAGARSPRTLIQLLPQLGNLPT